MPGEPFYITTAISYPNGRPHIGHAYEAVAADAIARFQRMQGRDVFLLTGTDEHGLKMVQTARGQGRETIDLADEMSGYFRDMCAKLNISIDGFKRTTDPQHHRASQEIWRRLEAKGDLYLDRYEGWYSVRDEAFYEESELVAGENGEKLSPQGTPVEWTVEESWFFRLSKYQNKLLELYENQPGWVRPESRLNEVKRFVEGGLRDLSVSRTSFDWGVEVPGSDGHVMYVWLDALTTYLSGIGFPDNTPEWRKFWPADIHLIGKDIVRFHTVYWPAFLMAADLPLPKQVFGHGFILARDGQKMSKSAGNSADPLVLAERYGVDALRYFFLREVSFGSDGSWSEEAIVARCNAELANSFGNLAQRTLTQIFKNLGGQVPSWGNAIEDMQLRSNVRTAIVNEVQREFQSLSFSTGLDAWLKAVFACNAYIDEMAPWALRKSDPDRMGEVLGTLYRCIIDLGIGVRAIVPASCDRLLDAMGVDDGDRNFNWIANGNPSNPTSHTISQPQPLFPRLEIPFEVAA
jgi:methionyl-tRNA synthetase